MLKAEWQKSSYCGSNACAEVAFHEGRVLVRNSKNPQGPTVEFTAEEWNAFLAGARAGEFDIKESV